MSVLKGRSMEPEPFDAHRIWEKLGITEHLGGIHATDRLLARCGFKPGQRVLDIGCGTGYTACRLGKNYGLQVVAADISEKVLEHTRARIEREGVSGQVMTVQADVHHLEFTDELFDGVIAESVLVFCDQSRAAAEVFRVLKPGGIFGSNEFTFLQPPPSEWKDMLSDASFGLDILPLLSDEWRSLFEHTGFTMDSWELFRLSLSEQVASHIRVDGWRRYSGALVRGLSSSAVWTTFFNRKMLRGWRDYPSYVGYSLMVNHKH